MEPAAALADHIQQLEEQLLRPDTRRSRDELERLLASDFVEFSSDGNAYDKVGVIEALQHESFFRRSISDFRLALLSEDVVLATYQVTRQSADAGEAVSSMRSSIWSRRNERWQLVFHQGTIRVAP
jgi:hypothetical protein